MLAHESRIKFGVHLEVENGDREIRSGEEPTAVVVTLQDLDGADGGRRRLGVLAGKEGDKGYSGDTDDDDEGNAEKRRQNIDLVRRHLGKSAFFLFSFRDADVN